MQRQSGGALTIGCSGGGRIAQRARIPTGRLRALLECRDQVWFLTAAAWLIQPSPYCPASRALFGPPAATKIGGGDDGRS